MWAVVFFAIASAVSYFGKFWHKVDESIKGRRRRELWTLERKRQRAAMRQRRAMGAGESEGGLAGTMWKPPEVN
jgi:CDP-diacylglycerol--glycerol-3-phosphate 3-phosphatidyltransferase